MNKLLIYTKFFNLTILCLILLVPNGTSYYFNGLPFLNKYETIVGIIIVPYFLFFIKDFIYSKKLLFTASLILLIKIMISFSPQTGVNVKQYFYGYDFIKTYDTFWNKENSAVQKFPWIEQKNFPLDWTHLSKTNRKKGFHGNSYDFRYKMPGSLFDSQNKINTANNELWISQFKDFQKLKLFYNFNFFITLDKSQILKINLGDSSKILNYQIEKYDFNNNSFNKIEVNKNKLDQLNLTKGVYKFNLDISYQGQDWKFNPYFLNNGDKKSLFKERIIFTEFNETLFKFIKIKILLSIFYDYLILLLLLLISFIIISNYQKKNSLNIFFSIVFFSSYFLIDILMENLFKTFNIIEGVGSFTFGIIHFSVLSFLIFLFYINKIQRLDLENLFKFISIPTCLYVFIMIFYADLQSFSWSGAGDDWTTFQEKSRIIVIENKWINAGSDVFYFRPGSRYIYALSHVIFGQSAFAFKMLNIWCIILCSFLVIKILIKFKCNLYLANLAGIILLSIYVASNFRWILMVGLSEYYSMIFLFIAFYLMIEKEKMTVLRFSVICLCGFIQIWLREEHAPVAMSLIFLLCYTYKGNLHNKENDNYFNILKHFCLKNIKIITLYFSIIIFSFFSIFIRNYFVGGEFGLLEITAVNTLLKDEALYITYFHTFSRLLFGVDQYYPTIPKLYSIINISAIIISFMIIFNYKKYSKINLALPIILFATIMPYFFVENIAYTPRYAIHVLPTSVLICALFFNLKLKLNRNEKNINYRI